VPDKREAPQDAELISAAETIASWARARRATWTSVPLPPPAFPREDAFIAVQPKVPLAPPTLAVPQPAPPQTSTAPVPTRRRPVPPWIGRALVAAVLVLAAAFGARALLVKAPDLVTRLRSAPPPTTAAPRVAPTTGSLDIKSTPPGARVLVDGKPRGLTPLNLDGIVPGRHEVTLSRAEGTVRRVITVAAGETVTVDEAIFSGWAIVLAPFDLTIAENGRVLPADDRNQILLAAGPHQLRLTNSALGYDTTKRIDVKPG